MSLSKSESIALKQIRAAAKDATERGDHAALATLPGQIDSLIANEASEGYGRRAAELREAADEEVEPTLVGWSIGADGITVRGEIPDNDMDAWRRVFVLAAEAITGLDGAEAERAVDAVIRLAGQIEDDPRNEGGVRELFPWSISGLEEVEYDGDGTGINALDLRDAALEAWEWPGYYKFEGGEALWFENNGRCAVAFNGNAVWTDAQSIEEGIGRVILGRVIA